MFDWMPKCRRCKTNSPRYPYGEFCSWECYNKHRLTLKGSKKIKCAGCGQTIAKFQTRIYCSDECKREHTGQREAITVRLRRGVMRRSDSYCVYCGDRAEHIDHVLAFSKGGTNEESNLVASCAACNMIANGRLFSSFEEKKIFILSRRKITGAPKKDIEINVLREEEFKRPAWHQWVYGGIKNKRGGGGK